MYYCICWRMEFAVSRSLLSPRPPSLLVSLRRHFMVPCSLQSFALCAVAKAVAAFASAVPALGGAVLWSLMDEVGDDQVREASMGRSTVVHTYATRGKHGPP